MKCCFDHLNKIEFVVTDACTGQCAHCSQGDHRGKKTMLDAEACAEAVRSVAARFRLKTVMAFGGEPLLNLDATCAIMAAATECGVPIRQVITNGYVTRDEARMGAMVSRLRRCGVSDLRLSVDAFHQETIPFETVRFFGLCAKESGIPIRIQPAWLVAKDADNPYNRQTRRLLDELSALGLPECDGNTIFPEGRAKELLGAYFAESVPENPYVEDPQDIRCLSVDADGGLLGGNIYRQSIDEILERYDPSKAI